MRTKIVMSLRLRHRLRGGSAALRFERGLGLISENVESGWVIHRYICENFPIEVDASAFQAFHKSAVGEASLSRSGVDALNPQPTEGALAIFAVTVFPLTGLEDGVFGGSN